jgi:membrane fusion protein, multidrug efflux system
MRVYTIFLAGLVIVSACNRTGGQAETEDPAVHVSVQQPVYVTYSDSLRTTGVLNTLTEVKLSFKTGGIVESVKVREGQTVNRGQLLATLNLSEMNARVRQSAIALEKQERDYKRALNLFLDSVITLETLQNAESAFELAKTEKSIADFNLNHSRITAPAQGKVQRILVEKDEIIAPGHPAILFASTESNWVVKVPLTDRDIVRFRIGDSAVVEMDALPGKSFSAEISELGTFADPVTGTFSAELLLRERDPGFRSGFIARTWIFPSDSLSGWFVPFEAVHDIDNGKGYVYLLEGTKAVKKSVQTGNLLRNGIILHEGVTGEDRVITEGAGYIREGATVKVITENQSASE